MSSEQRLIRPYADLSRFQAILDRWHMRIGTEFIRPSERAVIGSNSLLNDPAVLVSCNQASALKGVRSEVALAASELGFERGAVELVVLVTTPYLRLSDVAYRASLDEPDAIRREFVLGKNARALNTPSGGCDIEVAFCLASSQRPKMLRPTRKGTWLGRVRFTVRTELTELGFTPRVLTSELRARFGLPQGTLRFIDVKESTLLEAGAEDAVDLYLDPELLAVLNQSPHTLGARTFQRQLFLDVMAAITMAAMQLPGIGSLTLPDIEGSLLHHVLRAAACAGFPKMSAGELMRRQEEVLALLKRHPGQFLARLEGSVSLLDDLRDSIRGSAD